MQSRNVSFALRYLLGAFLLHGPRVRCPVGRRPHRPKVALVTAACVVLLVAPARAELRFESRVIEDTVAPDAKAYPFTFDFENTGDEPVEIRDIKTSCGCTTAELEKKVYAPGESGRIEGNFSIGNRRGRQEKKIRVLTDDLARPAIGLSLKVAIPQLVTLEPGLLLWRVGEEPAPKTLTVLPNADFGASVLEVTSESTDFALELLEPEDGRPSREVVVVPVKTETSGRGLIKVNVGRDDAKPKTVYAHALIR